MRQVVLVLLLLAMLSLPILLLMGGNTATTTGPDQVALIDIAGLIAENPGYGGTGPRTTINFLRRAEANPRVKAVVLRVNSGGGSPAAAEEIYAAIRRLRARGKPVVVSMGDVAASAAYYISAAADRIVANPSTMTGSIGVISQTFVVADLLQEYGVSVETIVSGPFKDAPSSYRHLTDEERAYMQEMVNDVLETFIEAVATGRDLDKEYIRTLADGRIFTGRQAHALRLVDELGGLEDAIMLAAELAGIPGRPTVVTLQRQRTWAERLLEVVAPRLSNFSTDQLIQWFDIPPWGYQLR